MKYKALSVVLLFVIVFAMVPTVALAAPWPPFDWRPPKDRVLVLSAFGAELELMVDAMTIDHVDVINGRLAYVGELGGNSVALMLTGVSMTNAAMSTQAALDAYPDTGYIVYSGIAGGVNPELGIGTLTIPAQWGEYQEAFFARADGEGWNVGWHSEPFGNYGMMFPQTTDATRTCGLPDQSNDMFWFLVDPDMLAVAAAVMPDVMLQDCVGDVCLDPAPVIVVGGNGVSGPTFVDNAEYRTWVWETFGADALDMETAATAHVAYTNCVPYLAFRSLSDLAGGGPGENQIGTFFAVAAENSATAVLTFLEAWAAR